MGHVTIDQLLSNPAKYIPIEKGKTMNQIIGNGPGHLTAEGGKVLAQEPAQESELDRVIQRLEEHLRYLTALNGRSANFLSRVRPGPTETAEQGGEMPSPSGHLHRISVLQNAISEELERASSLMSAIEEIG